MQTHLLGTAHCPKCEKDEDVQGFQARFPFFNNFILVAPTVMSEQKS
ncbi:MAG: hypothetical protein ACRCS4_02625 [Flavobacterium sp.]